MDDEHCICSACFFLGGGDLRLGDFPPQFDLLETHQDDQEGADFQIASFFSHTLTHVMEKFVSFGV